MTANLTAYRRQHPRCEWPGCIRLADITDHIVPLAEGGQPYDWANYQSLCTAHHQVKTTQDAQRGRTRLR